MYKAYFTRRLLEALSLADQATDIQERATHLRASRYYCALLGFESLPECRASDHGPVAKDRPRG
jgi:hypothetical protein